MSVDQNPSISDYALIGDTRTAALCSSAGSIDWMCLPRFDSEPVFGRLIGGAEAGSFSVAPAESATTRRRYLRDSAVLETHWSTDRGAASLTDGMSAQATGALRPQGLLVRHVRCTKGVILLRLLFDPKPGLPGRPPQTSRRGDLLVCTWGSMALGLVTTPNLEMEQGTYERVELQEGETLTLALTFADHSPLVFVSGEGALNALEETDRWWRSWAQEVELGGRWRHAVVRSLITLRLLTYSPSGAPVAAPTTSLPEVLGGSRNWDYRFSWPRDAAIGIGAFLAAGKNEEAASFLRWLLHASRLTRPRLEVLYTVFGKPGRREVEIHNVPGYRGSLPVRIGNAAGLQHQLDVYGWVVDAAHLLGRFGHPLDSETWRTVRGFVDFVARNWSEPDAGIWEVRGRRRHYVHSKLMAWVALDRGIRMAETRKGTRHTTGWRSERDALAREIRSRGFGAERGAYVWNYGSQHLDASVLVLPLLEFGDSSERVAQTIDAIRADLDAGGGLLYRYPIGADGMAGKEGAFLPCSFWLVQALARTGRSREAAEIFERLLELRNDVGLLSEEADPATGELLGNFPQAFTHATLVQAAIALEQATNQTRAA